MVEIIPDTLNLGEEFYYKEHKHMKIELLLDDNDWAVDLTSYKVRRIPPNMSYVYVMKSTDNHVVRVRNEDGSQTWVQAGKVIR